MSGDKAPGWHLDLSEAFCSHCFILHYSLPPCPCVQQVKNEHLCLFTKLANMPACHSCIACDISCKALSLTFLSLPLVQFLSALGFETMKVNYDSCKALWGVWFFICIYTKKKSDLKVFIQQVSPLKLHFLFICVSAEILILS